MTGYTTHTGTSKQFADNFDRIFGDEPTTKAKRKTSAKKATTAKAKSKKSSAKKKSSKKKSKK